ncbi:MAG TPA: DNA primase, partial [Prolixibacteraceae bacterium]|nr:DNA primase [Prolixibacteraceae bacterium]
AVKNRSSLPDLPTLPASVYAALPDFLQKVVARCRTNEERDVMLLGALATISSCLPNVFGFYDETRVFPNLFLFVTAQASAGKGRLMYCKRLVNPVHWELRKQTQGMKAQYETEMREYNLLKMKDFSLEKPVKPPEKMLFIPANNSTTGVFQLLSDNGGKGLIFETEGDT